MNTSEHIDDLLQGLLEGELDVKSAARAEEHLERCERCRTEWDALRGLVADVQALPRTIDPPRDLWGGIENRLRERPPSGPDVDGVAPAASSADAVVRDDSAGASVWADAERADPARRRASAGMRRSEGRDGAPPRRRGGRRRYHVRIGLATVVLAAVGAVIWLLARAGGAGWSVETLDGTPFIARQLIGEEGLLRPGQWLETGDASRARLRVGTIGEVAVEPNSRVQLRRATLNDHRIALREGRIEARIWAPPRLFFVETPSATAIDLGCAYTLDVDSTGKSILHVTSGYVELEREGKSSVVPAGAMCYASPDFGPGTVFSEDASLALQSALERYDFQGGREEDLDVVLAEARPEDAMTLWQLVERSGGERRERIYGRLVELVHPPIGATREGIINGDKEMFEAWRLHLGLDAISWWGYLREKLAFPD